MKKIMILGAGVYQVPLIKRAKQMGLYTIVVSVPGNYPGFALADKVIYENTVEQDRILEMALHEEIDGICTTGTDVAVHTIGRVCDVMGLSGVSEKGARIACSKSLMKRAFIENGVQTAECRYVRIDSKVNELEQICGELGYPVMFKAVDSSGSRGITTVSHPDGIMDAVQRVKSITRSEEYIIEAFVDGEEFGAQAFVQNGKLEFVLPHGDYVFKGNTGVPIGHYAPHEFSDFEDEIYRQTELAVKAMGIDNCAVNADFMLCDGKVYVLEIGARAGATCLCELVSIYFGYDYYEKILRSALGEKIDLTPCNAQRVPNASHLIFSENNGKVAELYSACKAGGNVVEVAFDCKVGDEVRKFRVGSDRLGHIITKGETLEEAKRELENAMNLVRIELE